MNCISGFIGTFFTNPVLKSTFLRCKRKILFSFLKILQMVTPKIIHFLRSEKFCNLRFINFKNREDLESARASCTVHIQQAVQYTYSKLYSTNTASCTVHIQNSFTVHIQQAVCSTHTASCTVHNTHTASCSVHIQQAVCMCTVQYKAKRDSTQNEQSPSNEMYVNWLSRIPVLKPVF